MASGPNFAECSNPHYDKALEHHKLCIDIAQQFGDKAGQVSAYCNLGNYYRNLGQYDKALEHHKLQLDIAQRIGDKDGQGAAYGNLGVCYGSLGQYNKALEHHKLHLDIAQEIGDKNGQGAGYGNLGICYESFGQYDKALEHHKLCLDIAQQQRDKADQGRAYCNLGVCYHKLGQDDKALEHHNLHLDIARQKGDKAGEGTAYGNLAVCYYSFGQYDKALEHYKLHLDIAKQIGDKAGQGRAYGNLGVCYHKLGQYDKALEHHKMSQDIAQQIGDKRGERAAYGNLGICYQSFGQYDKALEHHKLCLDIAQQIGDKAGQGAAYGNIGICYRNLGQYDKALEHYKLDLEITQQIGDKARKGRAYCNLGVCYHKLGLYDKALEHHKLNLDIAHQIGYKAEQGAAYGNLGVCCYSFGQYDKALEYHKLHLDIAREIGDKTGQGTAYGNLGVCYESFGQYNKALEHHKLHLDIAQEIGDKTGQGRAYGNLGICYSKLGQCNKALEHHKLHQDIAQQIGDKAEQGTAHRNTGDCYRYLGQYNKAEDALYNYCLRCREDLFFAVPLVDEYKASMRDLFIGAERSLIRILVSQNKKVEALLVAERGRSRALSELMLDTIKGRLPREVQEKTISSLSDIVEVIRLIDCTVLFFTVLDKCQLCTWVIQPSGEVEFKEATAQVVFDLLRVPSETKPRILKCEDRSLSCLYGEGRRNVAKQLNVHDFKTKSATAPVGFGELQTSEDEPSSSLGWPILDQGESGLDKNSPYFEEQEKKRCRQWYRTILGPVRQFVKGSEVVVVPDDYVSLVPFASLIGEDGQYVAESLRVRLVPSLTTALMILRDQGERDEPETTALIVGDPALPASIDGMPMKDAKRLPWANFEVEKIGELVGVEPITGAKATKQAVLQWMADANLIHIAAHGDAEMGVILLAPGPGIPGRDVRGEEVLLSPDDLERKRLKAKLVVLSCCQSGNGEVRAEGVMSIARAFLGAGAQAVLMTVQAIDDEATLFFMEEFYKHLIGGGKAGEALQRSMKTMMRSEAFHKPQFWAPFNLIGADVTPFSAGRCEEQR